MFDEFTMLDVKCDLELHTGVRLTEQEMQSFRTVGDIAVALKRSTPTTSTAVFPCATFDQLDAVCDVIRRHSPGASDLRPETSLSLYIGRGRGKVSWKRFAKLLGVPLPARQDHSTGALLFVFLYTFNSIWPGLFIGGSALIFLAIPLGLLLGGIQTFFLFRLFGPFTTNQPPAHFRTLADIVAFMALRPDTLSRSRRPLLPSDLPMLTRYVFAQSTGMSIRHIRLRDTFSTIAHAAGPSNANSG